MKGNWGKALCVDLTEERVQVRNIPGEWFLLEFKGINTQKFGKLAKEGVQAFLSKRKPAWLGA